jgi:hypothetical protein
MVISYEGKQATTNDYKRQDIIQNISLLCQGVNAEEKNADKIKELKKELKKMKEV